MKSIMVQPEASFAVHFAKEVEEAGDKLLRGEISMKEYFDIFDAHAEEINFTPIPVTSEDFIEVRVHTVFDDCFAPTDQDHLN